MNEKLTVNQQKIIEAMKANSKATMEELSGIIGIAKTNIARNVKKLVENNNIKRIGSTKGGYWKILE